MTRNAGLLSNVGESQVPVVSVEPVPVARVFLLRLSSLGHGIFQRRTVHEVKVEETIVVVVEDRDSSDHRFQ